MVKLEDKVIWITGASSGIGEEMAYQLCKKGTRLIISSRRLSELERVKSNCEGKYSAEIAIVTLDQANPTLLVEKAKDAMAIHGYVDILINNGGISQRSTVLNSEMEVYRRIMEVDYFAPIQLSKIVLPKMIERGFGQHVVITSATGIISTPLRSAYAAAKHALHGFYDSLHAEVYNDNVRVTLICPGYIQTNVSYNALTGGGNTLGEVEKEIKDGLSPQVAVNKIIKSLEKREEEVYFGGFKEMAGIYIKRLSPKLFAKALRKQDIK
jgi:short-subunit dehydrogenase